jgi:predicted nucleic acid-binding protein
MIHLDTNFLIQISVAGSPAHTQFAAWATVPEDINFSSIVWAEFLCGPVDATGEALARQIFPQPEPFLSADAVLAARLFNQTGRRSRSLADCMIAAVAIRCGAKLATLNGGDFQPLISHGLLLA